MNYTDTAGLSNVMLFDSIHMNFLLMYTSAYRVSTHYLQNVILMAYVTPGGLIPLFTEYDVELNNST